MMRMNSSLLMDPSPSTSVSSIRHRNSSSLTRTSYRWQASRSPSSVTTPQSSSLLFLSAFPITPTAEGILLNSKSLAEQDYNLNLKKESLINSIQYLNTQLLALREMFDKRQDQLKNSRFLISNNNVVSVIKRNGSEPAKQLFNNLDDNDDLQDYDSEFIYEDVHNQHRVAKENLFSDLDLNVDKNDKKIIKRDSMNKVI